MDCGYFDMARKGNHFSYLLPTLVGGQCPFHLKFALKVTHPFKTRQLWQISTYDVSTLRDSEKVQLWRTGIRSQAFRQAMDAYVTPKSPKGWLQKWFFVF